MDLLSYLRSLSGDEAEDFAKKCETSIGHLRNVAYGYRTCATDLAVLAEKHSNGTVTRPELRSDWARHWPELAERA